MRSRADVEKAIRHLEDGRKGFRSDGQQEALMMTLALIDVLGWVLGRPSRFQATVRECDASEGVTPN